MKRWPPKPYKPQRRPRSKKVREMLDFVNKIGDTKIYVLVMQGEVKPKEQG